MSATMIINFFEDYGLIMTFLATSGIVFVGALKALGIFSKLNPKIKKYVYFACSCITSIISCTVYLCIIDAFIWADWGMTVACVIGFTISIYGVYENTGIRTLLKKLFFAPIKKLLKSIPSVLISKSMTEEKILLLAKNLGSDILLQLANEIISRETAEDLSKSVVASNDISDRTLDSNVNNKLENKVESDKAFLNKRFFS